MNGSFSLGGGINTFEVFFKSVTLQLSLNVNEITNIALRLHYISVKFMLNWFIMDSFSTRVQTRGYYLPILSYLIWFFNFFVWYSQTLWQSLTIYGKAFSSLYSAQKHHSWNPPSFLSFWNFQIRWGGLIFPFHTN